MRSLRWFLVPVLLVALGCAQERAPINRVQPYALDKTFFLGADLQDPKDNPEFWTQVALVDVGYGSGHDGLFTSTYTQKLSRIRWDLTETHLIARLAYERIANSDGKGAGKAIQDGQVVASYRISSHFDIVKSYNPTTGEQMNIVEENAYDRPWYQRQYMRVDWSSNESTDTYDFDTLSLVGLFGSVDYEPLSFYVDDPNDDDAPYFAAEGGYFDVTTKVFAKPRLIDLSKFGWGIDKFPACFLDPDFMNGNGPYANCNPVELTVRTAYRQVEDHDFQPLEWDGYRFMAFGGFTEDRYGYARDYGMTDEQWHRFLVHFQIWEKSHYYDANGAPIECYTPATTPYGSDPHRDLDGNGTEDECEDVTAATGAAGSQCDTFKQRCSLPYQKRVPTPIPWFVTDGSNMEYWDGTREAGHNWDVALRVASRTAQYTECARTGGADCATKFPMYFGQQDDNDDAINLAREVDDCREGLTHANLNRDEAACTALADSLGGAWGVDPGVIAIAKMPEAVVLCHSPVEANDPAACGGPRLPAGVTVQQCQDAKAAGDAAAWSVCRAAKRARLGDIRYHHINLLKAPQTDSPWGISMNANDPLTGEAISISSNVWTHVNDLASQGLVDQLRYIKGELQTEEITEGQYIEQWAQAAEAATGQGAAPLMHRHEVDDRVSEFATGEAGHTAEMRGFADANPVLMQEARAALKYIQHTVQADARATSVNAPIYEARKAAARGTEFEAALMTAPVQQFAGVDGMPMSSEVLDMASPLRGGDLSFLNQIKRMKQVALSDRGACILEQADAPFSLAGLADVMEAKFGAFNPQDPLPLQQARAEKMRLYLANKMHMSVMVHEMGHSVGLRHNFVSSSDALHFRPQYWQLRTDNGALTQECTDLSLAVGGKEAGADCVGPRYFDPVTKNERDNLIWMWQNSSAMEYPGEIVQDTLGLAAWDFGAARMFYGEAVAVYKDPSYLLGTDRGKAMLDKMDSFGGILGFRPMIGDTDIHYSQMQKHYDLISDCKDVADPGIFQPKAYNDKISGGWHPMFDGWLVSVNGKYSKCRQQQTDFVPWTALRMPTTQGAGAEAQTWFRGGGSIDATGRLRVPYGFATDRWADLGNLSVYRHDNGADAYEIFNFMLTQKEVNHIFDNYRRGRHTFSVRAAANRGLGRYDAKMRDGAKGLTLMKNYYRDIYLQMAENFDAAWPSSVDRFYRDNVLASGMVFDHFAKMLARPQAGPHFLRFKEPTLMAADEYKNSPPDPSMADVIIPNGATGRYGNVNAGGRPVENALAEDKGEYDAEYTVNAGSYYDKMYSSMLFTESVDNFISDSLPDFTEARYRACSLADLFPEGYRRMLANALTNDKVIMGVRVAANNKGIPLVTGEGYPAQGIGWTSWWNEEPQSCFPGPNSTVCSSYGNDNVAYKADAPEYTAIINPQIGWEQQKFLIAWTMLYLPENQMQSWINMLRIWELGRDADPGFENRIEFHDPMGKVYVAKTFGKEVIFGKTVQRGIAARVLEYANELMSKGYLTTGGPDLDNDGTPDWYIPTMDPLTGEPVVKYDPGIQSSGVVCTATDFSGCTCAANRFCSELSMYSEVPFFMRQALDAYDLVEPSPKGLYD
jgi:hypothetical protein